MSQEKQEKLDSQEILQKVQNLKNSKIRIKLTEPVELNSLRKFLLDAIKDENVVDGHRLKLLFGVAFGIPQDTLEMQQLHELQIAYERKFAEIRQEQKIIRYIIIAIGAVLGVPEIIRLFGFG